MNLPGWFYCGCEYGVSATERRKIFNSNVVAVIGFLSISIFGLIYVASGNQALLKDALALVPFCIIFASILWFNTRGKIRFAIWLYSLSLPLLLFTVMFVAQGTYLRVHYYFIVMALAPIMFFPVKQWRSVLFLFALDLSSFVYAEYVGITPDPAMYELAPWFVEMMRGIFLFSSMLTLLFIVWLSELTASNNEARLEEASHAKSNFLSHMSHEIRTPMNTIIGMTQLALMHEQDKKQCDYLNKISLSGEHLLGVIDDILDFSKIEAGKIALENVDFDINKVKQTLTNLIAWKATEKNLKLTFEFDPAISQNLYGDPLRLDQILLNYTNNAIKFTQQGEIIVRAIKLEENENSTLLRFEVQDSGIGISEEQQSKLFQDFQQADSSISRNYGGSGLGLVISKQLAHLMGGEVGVASKPGRGSTFWFTARLGKGAPSSLPVESEVKSGRASVMGKLKGARILLVEDHPFNQLVAKEFLEDAEAMVCLANNGEEAIELLHKKHYDCVLMDAQMPIMDGFEATRRIRASVALAKIPVIAMTANALGEDRERCLAAGMNDFISKPFKPDSFYTVLAEWLPERGAF